MKKVYYLSTCNTCKRIIKSLKLPQAFIKQDIKTQGITEEELDEMYNISGSYKSLFNFRAKLFSERNLHTEELLEEDYKHLLLEHYSFLKRPVIINNDELYAGNSKKTIEEARESIHGD